VKSTLTNAQLIKWSITEERPQIRQVGDNISQVFAANLTDHHQRTVALTFLASTYTLRNELRGELFVNTKWGSEPLIFIVDPTDEIVIHGRVAGSITWERIPGPSGGYHRVSVKIREDPFALALP
jgi:hypothetical protein